MARTARIDHWSWAMGGGRSGKRSRPSPPRPAVEGLEGRELLSAAGGLDAGFANGGQYVVADHPVGNTGFSSFYSLKVRADGKIDAAGTVGTGGLISYGVLQLNPDGTPDRTFGNHGEVDLNLPNGLAANERLSTLLLLPGGKIFVAGEARDAAGTIHTVTAQMNADGSLDAGYGSGGIAVLPESGWALRFGAAQSDGKIVLVGFAPIPSNPTNTEMAAVRLNPNGSPDASFGSAGSLTISDATSSQLASTDPVQEAATGVAVDAQGRLLIIGELEIADGSAASSQGELFRLNPDGSRDSTFSSAGIKAARIARTNMNGVIVEPTGNIVAVGASSYGLADPILARIAPNGSLIASARAPSPFSNASDAPNVGYVVNDVVETPDGKFLMTGDEFTSNSIAFRLNNDFSPDPSFGTGGEVRNLIQGARSLAAAEVIAPTPDGKIVLAGTSSSSTNYLVVKLYGDSTQGPTPVTNPSSTPATQVRGDYTGSGKANPTLYLTNFAEFVVRSADGSPDRPIPFGIAGAGQSIPAPGRYDGSGKTNLAVYLPSIGSFAIRPANGGPDQVVPFGIAGSGQSIPAPGDYQGTGQTNLAVYLPSLGAFAIRPVNGGPDQIIPFGIAGGGQSIPVPGDYDGSGKTELAVYLPSIGAFAFRPAGGGPDQVIPFGIAGSGQSIPVPGDYVGDGRTDLAVYLPSTGSFAFRPAIGGPDVIEPMGVPGFGQTIPMPDYYDGTSRVNLAVYMPATGTLVIRPSSGPDLTASFGVPGAGQSIPVTEGPSSLVIPPPAPQPAPIVVAPPAQNPAPTTAATVKVTKHVLSRSKPKR